MATVREMIQIQVDDAVGKLAGDYVEQEQERGHHGTR